MIEKAQGAEFKFTKYIITDSTMHIEDLEMSKDISIKIDLNASTPPHTSQPQLSFFVSLNDSNDKFFMSLKIIGYFEAQNVEETLLNKFLAFNAPAILFPYVRAYVSSVTSQSGMRPLILPTINLHSTGQKLFQQLNSNVEANSPQDKLE